MLLLLYNLYKAMFLPSNLSYLGPSLNLALSKPEANSIDISYS